MRIQLRMLIATIAFIASATAAAADTATPVAPSGPGQSSQTTVWVRRTLHNFGLPNVGSVQAHYRVSCDVLAGELRYLLLQLGARASDLHIDEHDCPRDERELTLIDATFSVVVPAEKTANNAAGALADARWQIVEVRTGLPDKRVRERYLSGPGVYRDCTYLEYVTKKRSFPCSPAPRCKRDFPGCLRQDRRWVARPGTQADGTIGGFALAESQRQLSVTR